MKSFGSFSKLLSISLVKEKAVGSLIQVTVFCSAAGKDPVSRTMGVMRTFLNVSL